MAVSQQVQDQVTSLYLTYFNRAPDASGFSYWANQIQSGAQSYNQVANSFYAASTIPGLTATQQAQKLYTNFLGVTPAATDPGVIYWATSLATTPFTTVATQFQAAIAAGGGAPAALVANKITVGEWFATTLGSNDINAANNAYALVTADPASVQTAENSLLPSYTLTTNIDTATAYNFYGVQSAADGVISAASTLNAGDSLTGSNASQSTANLTFANTVGGNGLVANSAGARFTNVGTINATAVGGQGSSMDLSLVTGLQNLAVSNSSAGSAFTFNNAQTLAALAVTSNAAAVTVNYLDALVTPSTASTTVTVNGMINGVAGVALDVGAVTATVGFNTINIVGSGNASRISTLTTSTDNDLRTLNISGSGNVRIDDVDAGVGVSNLQTLNLSGSSATNYININRSAGNVTTGITTVTGGTGNDTVIFGAGNLTNQDVVDLGTGVNTLGLQYTAAGNGVNTLTAAQAAGLNTAANVQNISFVAAAAPGAGNTTLSTVDLGLLNTKSIIDFVGAGGVFANAVGAQAGGQAVAITGAVTGELLRFKDISGTAAAAGAGGNAGAAAADALDISSVVPFQSISIDLTTAATDGTAGVQIAGGAAGAGQADAGAGGVGGAAGLAIDGFGNVTTLNIASNGAGVAAGTVNSLIGGAAGNGGNGGANAVGAAGGAASVAIDNAAGLNVNITGGFDLSILGGAAGTAGTAAGNNAGGAGGARAYGFTAAVNVNASTFTGNLNIEGSAVNAAADVITGGFGNDIINGSLGNDYLTGGAGADIFEYLTGGPTEISNAANDNALGALADAANIESIVGFATGADSIRVNTSALFFGANTVQFTAASTATVSNVSLGNVNLANVDALLAAVNAAVNATASTAGVLSSYLVTTGTVAGGLANASNSTFLIVNNSQAAINNTDMIVKIVGGSVAATDFAFAVV